MTNHDSLTPQASRRWARRPVAGLAVGAPPDTVPSVGPPRAPRPRVRPTPTENTKRRILVAIALIAALATGACVLTSANPASAQAVPSTTITATVRYQDTDGLKPIRFAEVEIWRRQNSFAFWGYVDVAYTDGNGHLSKSVPYANGYQYILGVKAANYAATVRPVDDVTKPFMANAGEPASLIVRTEAAPGQSLDFSFDFTDPGTARFYNAAETVRIGRDYAAARRDPSETDVLRPANIQPTSGNTYNSPVAGVLINQSSLMDDALILHEYAHGLQQTLSSLPWIGSIHTGCVSTRPVFGGVVDSPQLAWQEGFADWFGEAVRLANPTAGLVNLGGNFSRSTLETSPACVGGTAPGVTGDAVELRVAGALWDLADATNEPRDIAQGRDTTIIQILDREQGLVTGQSINSFRDAWIARGLPVTELNSILRLNAIPAPSYTPLNPARLLDSRPGQLTVDGQQAGIGLRAAGSVTEVQVTGRAGVPADAAAVVLNVTVTEPTGDGHVIAYPCGSPRPLASNLNYTAGQTVPNAVVARVGIGGKVCLFTPTATQLIADVNGYFPTGSDYTPLNPARLLDSRPGQLTVDGQQAGIGLRAAGSVTEVQVTGRAGVPADAAAVVLNVTVTEPTGDGHVIAYPCGSPRPLASNLNYTAGQTVPNAVVARVGIGGKVCLFTPTATQLIADVNGYFPTGSDYTPLNPARLLDSRPGQLTVDGQQAGIGLRAAGSVTEVQVTGRAGVPADAAAVVLNVTVTEPTGDGHVIAYPCGSPRPLASNLNYTAGQTVPNAVVARVGIGGKVCLFTAAATQLITDVNGYFPTSP